MRTSLRCLAVAAACALAACGKDSVSAPWLTYPGVDGHIRFKVPLAGTSHDPSSPGSSVTCAGCHPGTTFTQPVCTTCHGDATVTPMHTYQAPDPRAGQVLPGYEWTPPPPAAWQRPKCLECHPQAGIPDASHHSFFPVANGTPHGRDQPGMLAGGRFCLACHSDPLDKKNLATLRCAACHADAALFPGQATGRKTLPEAHAMVVSTALGWDALGFLNKPQNCLRCHDRGALDPVARVATHGKRAWPPGFGTAGPWDGDPAANCVVDQGACKHGLPNTPTNCWKCHDALPPAFGGSGAGLPSRPWAQDWKLPATALGQTAGPTNARGTAIVNACAGCHEPKNGL